MQKGSGRRGSNPRHSAWEADTLPTELLPRRRQAPRYQGPGRAASALVEGPGSDGQKSPRAPVNRVRARMGPPAAGPAPWHSASMSKPTKAELRAALQQRRRERDTEEIAAQSAALLGHLLRHPLWQRARGIAAYVGVRGEPDTWGLLAAILAERKRLWLPRMVGRPAQIAFVPVCASKAHNTHDNRRLSWFRWLRRFVVCR